MKRLLLKNFSCLLLLACFVPFVSAQETKKENEHKPIVAKMDLSDGDSIVFLGDSITHQCLYTQYVEDYFYTRFPKMRLKFHNSGVGGAKAWDALQRFDRDVADYKPKYVTILLGMNDGRYQPFNQEIYDTYRNDMTEVIEKINKTGATPILMTPTMFDSRAAQMGKRKHDAAKLLHYNGVLALYGSWLQEVALTNGYGFVDMYSPLNQLTLQERKKDPKFTMIKDAIHPGALGQIVMAYAILNDMGVQRYVSNIRVGTNPKGKKGAFGRGGKLTEFTQDDEGLSFTWEADSLPMVLPEEAESGAKLLHLGHRLGKESIEIHDLQSGKYELSIDGVVVGKYPADRLAKHIEIQANSKTPQYQQAAKVAELNKERNMGPIRKIRGEWSLYQRWARAKKQSDDTPDNEAFKKGVATWTKKLEGREERIAKFEKEAKAIEDEIFKVNQPIARKYVLKLVK